MKAKLGSIKILPPVSTLSILPVKICEFVYPRTEQVLLEGGHWTSHSLPTPDNSGSRMLVRKFCQARGSNSTSPRSVPIYMNTITFKTIVSA